MGRILESTACGTMLRFYLKDKSFRCSKDRRGDQRGVAVYGIYRSNPNGNLIRYNYDWKKKNANLTKIKMLPRWPSKSTHDSSFFLFSSSRIVKETQDKNRSAFLEIESNQAKQIFGSVTNCSHTQRSKKAQNLIRPTQKREQSFGRSNLASSEANDPYCWPSSNAGGGTCSLLQWATRVSKQYTAISRLADTILQVGVKGSQTVLRGPPPATGPPPPMMIGSGNGGDTLSSYHSRVPFFYRIKEKRSNFLCHRRRTTMERQTQESIKKMSFFIIDNLMPITL